MFSITADINEEVSFFYRQHSPTFERITITNQFDTITLNGAEFNELVKRVQAARDSRDRTLNGSRSVREASIQEQDDLSVQQGEHSDPEC